MVFGATVRLVSGRVLYDIRPGVGWDAEEGRWVGRTSAFRGVGPLNVSFDPADILGFAS